MFNGKLKKTNIDFLTVGDARVEKYNKRVWLNTELSSSTGSLCCFYGKTRWRTNEPEELDVFLEIGDCRNKVRIHKCSDDSIEEYITKLKLISTEINQYVEFLEQID